MLRRRGRRLAAALGLIVVLALPAAPAHAAGPLGPDAEPRPGLASLWDLARQWLAAVLPATAKDLVPSDGGERGSSIDPNGATTDPTVPAGEHGSSIDPNG